MKQLALPLALTVLIVLAGCGGAPSETTTTPPRDQTFEVRMNGDSSATYVVTARLVADPVENVTVSYADGTNRSMALPDRQGAVAYGPDSGATAVEPRAESVGGVFFEGTPNFSVTDERVPATGTLVWSVRENGERVLVAWGLIRCDGHVGSLSLTTNESGVIETGFSCAS
ncbi:hypothetical protein BRC82_07820 [Halobacteriales archaeon QS_1_67_19]|nr:MAG: hypothetical protein BRC82_07820 [Halobacteriales archaeon QS_1_67_19]